MYADERRPLISFIISVYNLERYIGECLDSILSQPFEDYEIILVNNNSSDKSDSICRDYAAHHIKIKYYALESRPLFGQAHIFGFRKAQGRYVQYIDGDDMLPSGVYDSIANILSRNRPDVLFGRFNTFFEENIISFADAPLKPECINNRGKEQVLKYLTESQPFIIAMWRLIFSRDLIHYSKYLKNYSTIPWNIHQDTLISAHTFIMAQSVYYIDLPIYQYRVHPTSISRITVLEQVSECYKILLDFNELLQETAKTKQERGFAHVYIESYRYHLSAALCALDDEQAAQCAAAIKTVDIAKLRADAVNVIERASIAALKKHGDVYLAPTGNAGLFLKAAFEAKGLSISGFFDNDIQKDGMLAAGALIRLPAAIQGLVNSKPITVIIGSRYGNVRRELRQQFISLGINESDLITIEFG